MATSTKRPPSDRAAAKQAESRRRMLLTALVGVVVVGIIVLIAVLSSQEAGSSLGLDDIAGSPQIEGASLPRFDAAAAPDPGVGQQAPVVTGADFDGSPVAIGEPGRPQLVAFLASWCPACQQELPEMVAWSAAGGVPDGVDLVAVSTGLNPGAPEWPPTEWFAREGYTGPILVDDAQGSIADSYGLSATPYWVVLDAEGQVAARSTGLADLEQLGTFAATLVP